MIQAVKEFGEITYDDITFFLAFYEIYSSFNKMDIILM